MKTASLALLGGLGWLFLAASPAASDAPSTVVILNDQTLWRFHLTYHPFPGMVVVLKPEPGELMTKEQVRWVRWGEVCSTPPPPPDWWQPDFDDSGWPRRAGAILGGYGSERRAAAALLCVRGRFGVENPAKVAELQLALSYRGGVVVHLNGVEVARGHLPAGRLQPLAEAEDYPRDCFVSSTGALLPNVGPRDKLPAGQAERYQGRIRKLTVNLPAKSLRRGANVLALELHRAPIPADLASKSGGGWDTVGLCSLELTASASSAVTPNLKAPEGPQVWNAEPMLRPGQDALYGDPFGPLRPMALHAPRNGFTSGQVVVSGADGPITARVSDLKSGRNRLPASALQVRYADVKEKFVPLYDAPVAGAKIQPVWLTVSVPEGAKAGVYQGTLTLTGLKTPVTVPVNLTVYPWKLASPGQWKTVVNVLQSPESVAGYYQAPLWSDAHFEKMEKSLALMGRLGNKVLGISAVAENVFGDDPLIVFRKTGERYTPELKFADRYLSLYHQVAGQPLFVSVHVWNYGMYQRGAGRDGGNQEMMADTIKVWAWEGDQWVKVDLPMYGKPGTEELWREVMDGLRAIVTKLGWGESCLLLGTSGDGWPHESTVNLFKRVAPYAQWRAITHGSGVPHWGESDAQRTQPNQMVVGYLERVREITFRGAQVPGHPATCNARDTVGQDPFHYRKIHGLMVLGANYEGTCWDGIDYWPFTTPEGKSRSALNTYCRFGNIVGGTPRAMAFPGPAGALPTVQYEMYREGIQDCEALIFLRDAWKDEKLRARLGTDLARRTKAIMDDVPAVTEAGAAITPQAGADYRRLVQRLLQTASEVAAQTGQDQ